MVAETPDELQLLHDKHAIEEDAGLETHVLDGRGAPRRSRPYLADDLLGATYCPRRATRTRCSRRRSMPCRAIERGAVIRTHARGDRIDADPDGGAHRFTVTTAAGTIARAPGRQRSRRLGERRRGG